MCLEEQTQKLGRVMWEPSYAVKGRREGLEVLAVLPNQLPGPIQHWQMGFSDGICQLDDSTGVPGSVTLRKPV